MNNLCEHALAYLRRGFSVIPVKGKKPAIKTWKPYQTRRPTGKKVGEWFSPSGVTGIAVICGRVSGCLVCRDFDVANAYRRWALNNAELASTLPTVKTNRGYHVYFLNGCDTITKQSDGELRGNGYVLLPPSIHPDGGVYEWINKLPSSSIPEIDPFTVGLALRETECTEITKTTEHNIASDCFCYFSALYTLRFTVQYKSCG